MNGKPIGDAAPLTTKVKSQAQILLCKGCCCGQTDRGLPEVPVERIKAAWKSEKLNRGVQLTISGCLGPCDLPNVAVVVTSTGTQWYGNLDGDAHYDALIAWARSSTASGAVAPLPEALEAYRFERFPDAMPEAD
ncbi:MAG: (2Fe-2S) ferredoxin domain-containing protein [Isosphaeraceae bacterium]|nr:(2Fe-2S) ferredoxin domain-containing protein [Isosphaeraceae bacterium]